MITVEKIFQTAANYPLARIGRPDELLFFDIETTGFSGERDQVYLIGCTHPLADGSWNFIQWFADTKEAEPEVLTAFFTYLSRFRTLVHFNGEGFDLPFLLKRCNRLGLAHDFSAVESFDIFRRIRPWKKLLGMENMKQKAVERFLGVTREDQYNGGQLIEIYHAWLRSHDTSFRSLLLLHNRDDVKGMPSILPILSYPDFFLQDFALTDKKLSEMKNSSGSMLQRLTLRCKNNAILLPVPITCECEPFILNAAGNTLTLGIDLCTGELKHFYENYRDYYYLIYEDNAVHKSIGRYVAKGARTAANKDNCYTRRSGCFLPECSPVWEPVLKKERKDRLCYCELADAHPENAAELSRYLREVFTWAGIPG